MGAVYRYVQVDGLVRNVNKNMFLVISSGIIYAYYAMILKIDEEEFGGHGALLQEGLFVSIMLFLVLDSISLLIFFLFRSSFDD
ncbi:hypothetical protein C3L33_06989, partial [Rhododendron williamsianum]